MKYNALIAYRAYLTASGLAPSTAFTYYQAMDFLLQGQALNESQSFDMAMVLTKLEAVRYKNEYAKDKNAFLKFCAFIQISLSDDVQEKLKLMGIAKIKKHRHLKAVRLEGIKKRVRVIRDRRLRLAFMTMLFTGLRVSELAQIRREDSFISDGKIVFNFIGKGQRLETVCLNKDDNGRFYQALTMLLNETKSAGKVFPCASFLQTKAKALGFTCHDLRRAFAKVTYRERKNLQHVKKRLRHQSVANTRIYLRSKVII